MSAASFSFGPEHISVAIILYSTVDQCTVEQCHKVPLGANKQNHNRKLKITDHVYLVLVDVTEY